MTITQKGDRWFSNSIESFDGTAQNHGYENPQKLFEVFYAEMEKLRHEELHEAAIQFLKDEPEIRSLLVRYFDEGEVFSRLKRKQESTIYNFLASSGDLPILEKLKGNVLIHRSIEKLFLGFIDNPLKKYEIFGKTQVSVEEPASAR